MKIRTKLLLIAGELAELARRQQELVSRFKIDQDAACLAGDAPAEMAAASPAAPRHSTANANVDRETEPVVGRSQSKKREV